MKKAIWITWENQIRNRSMSSLLGAELYVFAHRGNRLKRYIRCSFDTLRTLVRKRPDVVFAQNPSIFLNYLLILCRPIFHYILVSDAHYGGVISCQTYKYFQNALDICNRLVDFVIVTNTDHAKYINSIKGKALICEDPLPDLINYQIQENNDKTILYICSFDVDEPYLSVFNASHELHNVGFSLLVSGNYNRAKLNINDFPHVTFLGFLPQEDYYNKLFEASVILDLTDFDNCLVCGAYEAMAANKPLVTSDTKALRSYFNKGTVFTKHDALSIVNSIKFAYDNKIKLKNDIVEWKQNIFIQQQQRVDSITRALGMLI